MASTEIQFSEESKRWLTEVFEKEAERIRESLDKQMRESYESWLRGEPAKPWDEIEAEAKKRGNQ